MASSSSSAPSPQYRSRFGDTTLTKVFVGGLAWETPTEELHRYFEQFGEILEAVIISDKITGRSKGYGFVTFRDPESARRSVADPNPVIDGRRANCNIASMGRPKPSPPRGRSNEEGSMYQGPVQAPDPPYSRLPAQLPFPSPPVVYPTPYGYVAYPSGHGYQQAAVYNSQMASYYYQQLYGPTSPSAVVPSPYHYPPLGYSTQTGRASFPSPGQGPRPPLMVPTSPQQYPFQLRSPSEARQPPNTILDSQAPQQTSTAGSDTDDQDS
ncbi:hypothetical protein OPV22_006475 [Ensete ventricosum]|uniref:RRM domain-containing protein n=1 Tax=Ensete ventricosum TaxID=4639 RepID=A0AAV8RPS4_ENSVE|nr:hypothetical protein OPV22_006475 [Ensete ventricosum]